MINSHHHILESVVIRVFTANIRVVTALIFGILSNNQLKGHYSDESLHMAAKAVQQGSLNQTESNSKAGIAAPIDSVLAGKTKPSVVPAGKETAPIVASVAKPTSANNTSDNYPTFRGPGGFGVAFQKSIPIDWDGATSKNVLWKTATPLPGYNSPVVWGDKIFLTGANESKREVYCIDKNSGKIVWTAMVSNISGSPSQIPPVTKETGFAAPTAAANAQGVYAIFSNGDLIALDPDGKQRWAQNLGLPQNHYGHASSLMIYNDLLIIQFDQRSGAKIFALNTLTGKTVWTTNRPVKVSWSSPILVPVGNKTEVITTADPYVAGYDAQTGAELWKLDNISGEVGPSAAYVNGIVFAVNDYSKLSAIKLGAQPVQLWENNEYLSDIPSPVAFDKYLFVVTSYGVVACYDVQTGNKYWEKELNNTVFSSPVIAENKVYLMDRTGIMHIFKVDKEYTSLGEPKLEERSACTPAFSNGRIYLRGDKNLFCIGK